MCDWCRACCSGEEEDPDREVIIYMNDREANAPFEYPSNYIVTSKYTLWSFLPMALAMQFTKASNVYFLINMIFSLIPGVAPVSPATAIAPLCFVLIVALIKEAVEDIRRHQADDKANDIPAEVLVGDKLKSVPSSKIVVGDIIRVNIGEEIRADMLLCASSVVEGQAFIDTCNLDGETNLKSRRALEATWGLCSEEAFLSAKMVVRTKAPDPGLLSWGGVVQYDGNELAVSLDQFMYRGCVLRNTDWIWGVVLYAGVDTKMFRNLKEKPPKSSTLDKRLNWVIIVIFVVQNIFLFIVCSLACWFNHQHKDYWYMEYFINYYTGITLWGYRYLSYFMLFSYFIPISLFVTIELCKVVQAHWMRVDAEMMEYMDGRWRHCTPNTSNLNEQLALVKFIFSDKTGTLTENVMKYKLGDALGVPIDRDSLTDVAKRLRGGGASDESTALLEEYFLALALCNTIQPFRDEDREGGILYEGSSPDEIALVDTASQVGFTLANRTTRTMTITRGDVACVFNILATLEFTPERKMMSIIVEDPNTRKLTLYNKGADSFVLPQLSRDPKVQSDADAAVGVLKEMSSEGLRTLMVCAKDITRSEFDAWNARFMEAGKLLQNRAEEVDKVCLEMEKDMRLIGLTAIEDKLQDQVPETLSFFLSAGVVIWMLTGDKRETAVTIAATSTLCDPRTDFIDHVDLGSLDPEDDKAIEKVRDDLHVVEQHLNLAGTEEERKCTLVIDGPALTVAMENFAEKFLEISERVNSAVCCRLTPIQKANVVHMFQTASGHTALAIGDGANDVSMIQEGKVGVGIMGLEGAQAALAADYAIPRFKHLRRLCAVHGRYALLRNATCIMVSFYKNITLSLLQFIFACYAGYSAQTLFDGWLLTFYNVALTSITPFLTGIFEKDLPEDALMERPKLFTPLADGLYFNPMVFLRWSIEATAHSLVLYYLSMPKTRMLGSWTSNIAGDVCGTLIFCGLIAVVLTRFCIAIRYWQWIQLLGVVISIVALIVFVVVYSLIPSVMGDSSFYWQLFNLMRGAEFWLTMIFYIGTVLVVDLSILHFQKRLFPTIRDLAEREYFASRRTRKHNV